MTDPSTPAYFTTAQQVCTTLSKAMAQAIATLPAHIKTQQWMAAKHSPASWRSVEHWYLAQEPRDPQILETVTNLALLSDALASVTSVTTTTRTGDELPLDLSLRKQRRLA